MRARTTGAVAALDPPTAAAPPRPLSLAVRVVGAALLLATGWIHLDLWLAGYRGIPWIGPLFLADAVLTGLAAVAVLLAPARWLPGTALLAGLLELGTLGGLVLSLTVGLFGFVESLAAPLVVPTIVVESTGFLVLAGYGGFGLGRSRQRARGR